jgi:ferredoxin
MAPRTRILIDPKRCIGATACVLRAPSVFALDADARSVLKHATAALDEALESAVADCPTGAIRLEPVPTHK